MKLSIGADHAGFKLKSKIVPWLRSRAGGHYQVRDVGTASEESVDYPDFARDVAKQVASKKAAKGILFCGTGIGMAITANKVHGIRAAVVWNPKVAGLAAEHNDANIICLPSRFTSFPKAKQIIKTFLSTSFAGGRHLRRVKKIEALDKC
jgi:ribose 5-phosphate isomerase B